MKLYIINEEIYIAAESYGKAEEIFKENAGRTIYSIKLLASEKDGGKYLIIEKNVSK